MRISISARARDGHREADPILGVHAHVGQRKRGCLPVARPCESCAPAQPRLVVIGADRPALGQHAVFVNLIVTIAAISPSYRSAARGAVRRG
jgi:hypothetical protein